MVDYTISDLPVDITVHPEKYENYQELYKQSVLDAIEKEKESHE